MKKVLLLFFAPVALFVANPVFADSSIESSAVEAYFVDDQKVEQLISQSEDVSQTLAQVDLLQNSQVTAGANQPARIKASDDKFVAALLLNFFLGGFGIHRLYLGTETITWVGYILTCGGIFGIVPLIDFIVIIVNNENLSPYINNPKYFMWSK